MSQGASSVDSEVNRVDGLKEIIKGFLEKYRYLHEYRLQKLIYIAELVSLLEQDERLTSLRYKPYMYGSYADNLPDALEDLQSEIDTKTDLHHGEVTTAYLGKGVKADLTSETQDIIDRVHQVTASKSNDELGEWSKETFLYQSTEYGKPMRFHRILQQSNEKIRAELENEFPELFQE